MKKLLILLSIFFLLSNSNIKSAGRSDDAATVTIGSKEEKEKTEVGRYPSFSIEDRKVMEELVLAFPHIPAGISGIMLDYCKTQYEHVHTLDHSSVNSSIILDKTHFASASYDGTIKIWQYDSSTASVPTCIHTLNQDNDGHTDGIIALIKLDDTHFVSGSYDKTIKIWEFNLKAASVPPKCIHTVTQDEGGHTSSVNLLIKLDDTHFASGSRDGTLKTWLYNSRYDSDRAPICCATLRLKEAMSLVQPLESTLVSSDYGTIKIWEYDIENSEWKCIHTLAGNKDMAHALIRLDATHFASSAGNQIKIWEYTSATYSAPKCIQVLDHCNDRHDQINSLIKLDDTHFASASFYWDIKIWELNSESKQWICVQTLAINNPLRSINRLSNGDLIIGLQTGMQVFKQQVVDIVMPPEAAPVSV